MRNGTSMLLLTLAVWVSPGTATAADAAAGRAFARENCSRCHAIDRVGASPLRKAPPFREIARRYRIADLEESLARASSPGIRDAGI